MVAVRLDRGGEGEQMCPGTPTFLDQTVPFPEARKNRNNVAEHWINIFNGIHLSNVFQMF